MARSPAKAKTVRMLPIDAEMRARFAKLAPGTLERRSPGALLGHAAEALQWLLLGGLGLYGLATFEAGPNAVLLVFLVGLYAGIVGEWVVYLLARDAVRAQMARISDDRFVSAMVDALAADEKGIPESALQPAVAGMGLLLDLVLGTLCGLIWFLWSRHAGLDLAAMLADPRLMLPLAAVLLMPLLGAAGNVLALRRGGDASVKAGGRGLALLVMTLTLMATAESGAASRTAMLVINLAALALAALSAFGLVLLQREGTWLRRHLQQQDR